MEPIRFIITFTSAHNVSLLWASWIHPKPSSPIFLIYLKEFQVAIYFVFVSPLNHVHNSPLHHTCQMPCPCPLSWYGHTDYAWCNVPCHLLISCLWFLVPWYGAKKTRIVCRTLMTKYRLWVMILVIYGSGLVEMFWFVFIIIIIIIIYCNWVLTRWQ